MQRNFRVRDLAQIHLACKQLGIEEDEYRTLLCSVCGVGSAKDLDVAGRARFIAHLRKLGWTPKPRPQVLADDKQSKKIRALWLALHAQGAVRNPSEAALALYVKRQTKVAALQWLSSDQASRVIEALKAWVERCQRQSTAAAVEAQHV